RGPPTCVAAHRWVSGPIDVAHPVGHHRGWMGASARRVRAERNRRRLPPRRTLYRWTRRITGLLATAAFLGVGVAAYRMIAPDHSTGSASLDPAPAATPARHHKAAVKHKAHKPKGLTKA